MEIKLSELCGDNEKFRIDSEFFLKKYLFAYQKIKSKPCVQIKDIAEILTDFSANGSYENIAANFKLLDSPDYAYMVRTTDLEKDDFYTDVKYISEHSYKFLSKSQVFGGELLINKIGSPGRVYLMPELKKPVSLGMNLFLLRIKKSSGFNEIYVWTFLNSAIGKEIIFRKINGTVPLTIDKEAIRSLYIPILPMPFQLEIERLVKTAHSKLEESKQLYAEAEAILLTELGLNNWTPENKSVSIKSFSDFTKSGRLDAEYYQPKYDDLFAHLQQFECRTIGQISNIKKSIEPGSEAYQDSGIPFIRVSNITKFGLTDPEIHLDKTIFADELKPKKNTILLTKDGSVGMAYKVSKDLEAITSGALLHINITDKYFLPDYVTLVINSIVVKLQAERDAGGSIIQHWKPSEIAEVIIPKLPLSLQSQIANKIQTSFSLKSDSKALLERAKQMVEKEIEKN